jgi:hypothetical protein
MGFWRFSQALGKLQFEKKSRLRFFARLRRALRMTARVMSVI